MLTLVLKKKSGKYTMEITELDYKFVDYLVTAEDPCVSITLLKPCLKVKLVWRVSD